MKRHLLLAAVLAAPLYLRQREVERRQRLRNRALEAELRRTLGAWSAEEIRAWERVNKQGNRIVKEVNEVLQRFAREIEIAGRL